MANIPGFRFDISGASGSQGLLGPKDSWKAYFLPRGGYASQDSTGALITFDSASVASRFAVGNWIQAGLNTANIRQVGAVGGNSVSISGSNLTISENDRIYLIGNTEPTVNGNSATYTPKTIIRKRDDDAADVYTNSMVTTDNNGLVQGFSLPQWFDVLIQDGNGANQGSIIDLWVQDDSPVAYADAFTVGSSTGGIQEAINSLPGGKGKVVMSGITYSILADIIPTSGLFLEGQGMQSTVLSVIGHTGINVIHITSNLLRSVFKDFKIVGDDHTSNTGFKMDDGLTSFNLCLIENVWCNKLQYGWDGPNDASPGGFNDSKWINFEASECGTGVKSRAKNAGFYMIGCNLHNQVQSGADTGIGLWANGQYNTFVACTFANNEGWQIKLEGAQNNAFYGQNIESHPSTMASGCDAAIQLMADSRRAPNGECNNILFSGQIISGKVRDYLVHVGDGTTATQVNKVAFHSCFLTDVVTAYVFTDPNGAIPQGGFGEFINCQEGDGVGAYTFFDTANGGNRWHLQSGPFFGGYHRANTAQEEGIWWHKTTAGTPTLSQIVRTVASTVPIYRSELLSESFDRFKLLSDGSQWWGDGTAGPYKYGLLDTQAITGATDTITTTAAGSAADIRMRISNNTAADIPLTSNPTITNGTYTGQMLNLFLTTGSTASVFISDGNNVQLNGSSITLTPGDSVSFLWDGTDWIQHTPVCVLA